jgi:UDP-hydrolysing UDP-N-acetyl-D-glucosamine 2-epimerase
MRRRICIVTATRAEYGLLKGLIKEVEGDPALDLQLVVTGTHLAPRFGRTISDIKDDGFPIAAEIAMEVDDDSATGAANAFADLGKGLAVTLSELRPDILVLLGDRYEMLAAASAAMISRIPIAHIHGGEVTLAALDEAVRHAITKMAHLHFPAAEEFGKRIYQMGEPADRIFVVGAPAIDAIETQALLDGQALSDAMGISLSDDLFVITHHPVTLSPKQQHEEIESLLNALRKFPDAQLIFTGINADPGNRIIRERIETFVSENSQRAALFESLGQLRYFSLVKLARLVIGNSSSGIIEAPALKTATVNIGDRQTGRPRAQSIIDCEAESAEIAAAIERALSPNFQDGLTDIQSPYGAGDTARRIKETLATFRLDDILIKPFNDIEFETKEAMKFQ